MKYILIILMLFITNIIFSKENLIPHKVQTNLITNIFAQDKNLVERCKDTINYLIAYKDDKTYADGLFSEISKNDSKQIAKLNFKSFVFKFESIDALKTFINDNKINAIYFVDINQDEITSLESILKDNKILSFSKDVDLLTHGLSVGFDYINNKLILVINKKQSDKEKADFSLNLLKFSKVLQ